MNRRIENLLSGVRRSADRDNALYQLVLLLEKSFRSRARTESDDAYLHPDLRSISLTATDREDVLRAVCEIILRSEDPAARVSLASFLGIGFDFSTLQFLLQYIANPEHPIAGEEFRAAALSVVNLTILGPKNRVRAAFSNVNTDKLIEIID